MWLQKQNIRNIPGLWGFLSPLSGSLCETSDFLLLFIRFSFVRQMWLGDFMLSWCFTAEHVFVLYNPVHVQVVDLWVCWLVGLFYFHFKLIWCFLIIMVWQFFWLFAEVEVISVPIDWQSVNTILCKCYMLICDLFWFSADVLKWFLAVCQRSIDPPVSLKSYIAGHKLWLAKYM